MSFLDNLENTLNRMERGSEEEDSAHDAAARAKEVNAARAAAPHAEALKKSPWTNDLLTQAVTIGHGKRVRVGMTWIGTSLRLDAREHRLELRPVPEGIQAVFLIDGEEKGRRMVDLNGDAGALAREWLGSIGPPESPATIP